MTFYYKSLGSYRISQLILRSHTGNINFGSSPPTLHCGGGGKYIKVNAPLPCTVGGGKYIKVNAPLLCTVGGTSGHFLGGQAYVAYVDMHLVHSHLGTSVLKDIVPIKRRYLDLCPFASIPKSVCQKLGCILDHKGPIPQPYSASGTRWSGHIWSHPSTLPRVQAGF